MTIANPTLRDHMLGKFLNFRPAPLQDGDFQTAIVIDVNVQRRLSQIMMIVKFLGQTLR